MENEKFAEIKWRTQKLNAESSKIIASLKGKGFSLHLYEEISLDHLSILMKVVIDSSR